MVKKNFWSKYWRSNRKLGDNAEYLKLNTPVKPKQQKNRTLTESPAPKRLTFNCADSTPYNKPNNPKPKVLKLNNYVLGETNTNVELLEQRMLDHDCQAILFVDCIEASDLRLWSYNKTRLCRQLGPLLLQHQWTDQGFQTTVVIHLQDGTLETIVHETLDQIQKDPEIVGLQFRGTMERSQDLRQVVFGLVGLLSLKDRQWQRITFEEQALAFETGVLNTDTAIRKRCRRILKEASAKFKVPIDIVAEKE